MLILPVIVLLPFVAAAVSLLVKEKYSYTISIIASSLVLLLAAAAVLFAYSYSLQSVSFSVPYINSIGISLGLSFTSFSVLLSLMTAIVFFSASLVGNYFIKGSRLYNLLFLVAEGASMGVFLASNLFLFYVFWEVAEVMMFFIIFLFGGYERRYAAIKFIIYSLVSSLLLLIAIMLLYSYTSTFEISSIASSAAQVPQSIQLIITLMLMLTFMIKMPAFPFHSWLPDAHTEAPATGSMILAGVLLKFGGYGLLLMFLLVPLAHSYAAYIALIFIFSTLYSAIVTFRQSNIKRLIAYTSITDMGIVGVAAAASGIIGNSGAIYGMVSHAFAISILFMIAGSLDETYGTLEWRKIAGVMERFPALAYLFVLGTFMVVGLPITAGFIGDLLIFISSFSSFGFFGIAPIAGILLIGAVLFWIIEKVFVGPYSRIEPYSQPDISVAYAGIFLAICSIVFGLLPFIFVGALT
ncbi:MAG: NADH-quinone oxidoreductase subunit M [Candidatus Micrarchaeaceae archaeon]